LDWIFVSGPDTALPSDPGHLPATGDGGTPPPAAERYILRLFVTGMTSRSVRAIRNLQAICGEYLEGRFDLEVVDIYQQPALTQGEQIVAAPTLIKKFPLPQRRLVGDMSDRERVLLGLDLVSAFDRTK
jgi:circadian clock protein KaiB